MTPGDVTVGLGALAFLALLVGGACGVAVFAAAALVRWARGVFLAWSDRQPTDRDES